jgi:hypothetical protein
MQLAQGPQIALVGPPQAPRNVDERWAQQEALDKSRMPRPKRDPYLEILGCSYFVEGMVLSLGREAAKFWRALPEIRVLLDPLDKGVTVERAAWRGRIARANGWRWVAFAAGQKIDEDALREAAGRV